MSLFSGVPPIDIRLFILFALSGVLSYVLMPLCYLAAGAIGAYDQPGDERRVNTEPTPRLGGLGFFAAFFIVILLTPGAVSGAAPALLVGGALLVALGVSDDAISLPPPLKLVGQIAAAMIALSFIEVPSSFSFFGLFAISLPGILGYLFSLFRIVFTINAVNFSDGLDGLAAGLSATALIAIAVFAAAGGRFDGAIPALFLTFSLFGFLPFNKHKAKMFMGDCGSQFLGYAIAVLSISASPSGSFTLETSLFIAIPVIDTWFSVARRLFHGKSPFSADKGHLHHLLLAKGLSHEVAVRVLVSLGALIALLTLLFS